jgi:hypothetical protein
VWTRPLPDGMAELGACGPAAAIQAMFGALDARATKPRAVDDTRLIGARRFDALLHALTGPGVPGSTHPPARPETLAARQDAPRAALPGAVVPRPPGADSGPVPLSTHASQVGESPPVTGPALRSAVPSAGPLKVDLPPDADAGYVPRGPGFLGDSGPPIAAVVHVTMDLPTLLGLADNPAQLEGYGALPAALARDLAASNPWRRLVTDPISGALLDAGRRSYRPSAALADFIRARDRTCIFPGCGRSAWKTDADHRIPFSEGGLTERANLGSLCARHHRIRHRGWTYEFIANGRDTTTGEIIDKKAAGSSCDRNDVIWTSPAGRTYTSYPDTDTGPLTPPPELHPDDQATWNHDQATRNQDQATRNQDQVDRNDDQAD